MKAAMVFVLILATTIILTGCGHYGMGRHYNNNSPDQIIPGSRNMHGNSINTQGGYMNEDSTQNQGIYMNGNSMQDRGGYRR